MDVKGTLTRWYHKPLITISAGIFIGLVLGAAIVGITLKQLYYSAKGRISSAA